MASMKRRKKSRGVSPPCGRGRKSLKSRAFSHYRFTLSLGFCVNPMFCLSYNSFDCIDGFSLILVVVYVYLVFFLENKKGHEQHMTLVKHLKPDRGSCLGYSRASGAGVMWDRGGGIE